MKTKLASVTILSALLSAGAAFAAPLQISTVQSVYNVDIASRCANAVRDSADPRQSMRFCDEALAGATNRERAGLLVDRGILKFRIQETAAALADFDAAVTADPAFGDAYLNRAVALIALNRDEDARPDVDQAIALGSEGNMHVAYYSRAVIEDDAGNYRAAFNDYQQALALKPDYAPAKDELRRFRTASRTASNTMPRQLLQ